MQLKSRDGDAMPDWKMFVVRRWKSEQTFHKLLIMRARVSKREGKWSSRRDREMLQSSWADAAAAAALGAGAGCDCDPPLTFPTQRWHFKWSVFLGWESLGGGIWAPELQVKGNAINWRYLQLFSVVCCRCSHYTSFSWHLHFEKGRPRICCLP